VNVTEPLQHSLVGTRLVGTSMMILCRLDRPLVGMSVLGATLLYTSKAYLTHFSTSLWSNGRNCRKFIKKLCAACCSGSSTALSGRQLS
jgi:hypothetical protein